MLLSELVLPFFMGTNHLLGICCCTDFATSRIVFLLLHLAQNLETSVFFSSFELESMEVARALFLLLFLAGRRVRFALVYLLVEFAH